MTDLKSFRGSEEHSSAHANDVRIIQVGESAGPVIVLACDRWFDGRGEDPSLA